MKAILKMLVIVAGLVTFFASCDKVQELPFYANGTAASLSASSTTVAPTATDSDKVALILNWTYPNHATDTNSIKYTIDIDTTGKNFAKASTKVVTGKLTAAYTGKELNSILVGKGYAFGVPVDMDVRVTSSYGNNNEPLASNIIKIKMTPYKIPPKVALPTSGKLFLVGNATQGGWDNPVPAPSQEFARIDETTFAGIFQLNGGKEYLILPVNGDWTNKYAVPDNSKAGINTGGDFGLNAKDNFPAPSASGIYKIVVDFQTGKYVVTPYTGNLPNNLYMVGDATSWGWNNPVPESTQKFTRRNSVEFDLTVAINGGKEYLLLPENGSWDHKYAIADKGKAGASTGGDFGYDINDNFPAPATSGNYKISINFATGKYTVVK